MSSWRSSKILVTGTIDEIGRTLVHNWRERGYEQVVTYTAPNVNLRDKRVVNTFFERELPDVVVVLSPKVSAAPRRSLSRALWLRHNLLTATNVIHAAYLYDVEKLLYIDCGLTCFDSFTFHGQSGAWAASEDARRLADVAGSAAAALCDSYRSQYGCSFTSAFIGNLYGPGVNFAPEDRHVVATLLREVARGKRVGSPSVEVRGRADWTCDLLHVEDFVDVCTTLLQDEARAGTVSVEPARRYSVSEVAAEVRRAVGYDGEILFDDVGPPDLAPMTSPLASRLDWTPRITLPDGLSSTLQWFLRQTALSELN
ncbi:NAD-dependent epimerase/dehydratase family protein [Deinococcus yavapaiensis]|uniref:GDP-L-fucose synthase n=1 Tax=Deinococcus yavapaiensis KR-236 TaxID=694435 RepID=A0A318S963_9DEIO|nr:NAD-dependent epimerase/dehydratase family protein [Deinococcus yavapaiensis]PYE55751.1 GDP-L-fucose synthase [Deinococcus yavapaiensis KR-236]